VVQLLVTTVNCVSVHYSTAKPLDSSISMDADISMLTRSLSVVLVIDSSFHITDEDVE